MEVSVHQRRSVHSSKKLIAAELTRKPLSDSKLTDMLELQGIKVARRTIAKYRESMNIPPSNERKRLTWDQLPHRVNK